MIGDVLRYIRICNELTAKEAANKANIQASLLSELESNKRNVSLRSLERLSKCYNMEISKIMYLSELEAIGKTRAEILIEILNYYIEKEENNTKVKQKFLLVINYFLDCNFLLQSFFRTKKPLSIFKKEG